MWSHIGFGVCGHCGLRPGFDEHRRIRQHALLSSARWVIFLQVVHTLGGGGASQLGSASRLSAFCVFSLPISIGRLGFRWGLGICSGPPFSEGIANTSFLQGGQRNQSRRLHLRGLPLCGFVLVLWVADGTIQLALLAQPSLAMDSLWGFASDAA